MPPTYYEEAKACQRILVWTNFLAQFWALMTDRISKYRLRSFLRGVLLLSWCAPSQCVSAHNWTTNCNLSFEWPSFAEAKSFNPCHFVSSCSWLMMSILRWSKSSRSCSNSPSSALNTTPLSIGRLLSCLHSETFSLFLRPKAAL